MRDAIEQFRTALHNAGLTPPEVVEADGKLHRFATNDKRRDNAGWYVFYGDGLPAGAFGDWCTGSSEFWRADIGRGSKSGALLVNEFTEVLASADDDPTDLHEQTRARPRN